MGMRKTSKGRGKNVVDAAREPLPSFLRSQGQCWKSKQMATESILPVQIPRRRNADPSRRQRILQEKAIRRTRDSGGQPPDAAVQRRTTRSTTVSDATPSRPRTGSQPQEPGPLRRARGREKQRGSRLSEETDDRPNISAPDNAEIFTGGKPLPSDDVLNALFSRLMDKMKLPPERVAELNMRRREYKWSLILAQHEIQQGIACVFYVEQLVRHAQPELKEKRPKKKLLENLQPLGKVLRDLEVDLRTNPNDSWVEEFVGNPNHGHVALIDLIKDLADHPISVPRKNGKKYTVLNREPTYLHNALLCVKALTAHRAGFNAVLSYDPSLSVLAYCLDNPSAKVRVLVLKLMVTVLLAPGGHKKVMQAFDYFRAVMKERTRFQMLMSALVQEPVDPAFQAAVLCFINTVVQTAHGPNARVFHQHEFLEAGFSVQEVERSLHGRQDERVLHELREWAKNFIDIQQYMDDLAVARGRARDLKEDLETHQRKLHEANIDRENQFEQIRRLLEKTENQREKILTLNENINKLLEVKLERDQLVEENEKLAEANKRYHLHTTELKDKVESLAEEKKIIEAQQDQIEFLQDKIEALEGGEGEGPTVERGMSVDAAASSTETDAGENGSREAPTIPPAPPPPPIDGVPMAPAFVPPPPPIGGGLVGVPMKKAVVPNVPLPMLNWLPIKNPEHTIFKDLNDEAVLETIDFSEFEAMFQVKRIEKSKKDLKREENLQKLSEQLQLIEQRRARNLVIAKRRIGHTSYRVTEFIMNADLDGLLPEHCELLLKFIPTEEELADLTKHSHRLHEFGEAERFIFDLARLDRYESRLTSMAYMGNFDDLLTTTQPQIDAVLSASLSVFRSARLKKIFEIILAFGNYMNSSRRGAVYGFRLESLSKLADTRSTYDKKQTLLHYLAHVVEKLYPHQLSFYDDLDIDEAAKVSNQILAEDVRNLRVGLEDVKKEKEKEPDNFILFSFYLHAQKKVEILTETFSKMEDAYREVCLMFSESPKTVEPSEFFGMFQKFVRAWKQAVHENHEWERKRKRGLVTSLLKKPEEEKEMMAELAVEAAAAAAMRRDNIIEETKKLSESGTSVEKEKEAEKAANRIPLVSHDQSQDIHDIIKEKGVHHLDFSSKFAWLKDKVKRKVKDEGEGEEEGESQQTGEQNQLKTNTTPEQTTPTDHTPDPLKIDDNDGNGWDMPPLPPKDYLDPDLPPRDYPTTTSEHIKPLEQTGDLISDDDYYAQMMNALNS